MERHWYLVAGLIALGMAASYGLAVAGEPQSLWWWRDVLGVIGTP